MSDWSKPFKVAYRVMRVNRNTGLETGRLDWVISGGSIERNQDTNICESGSLTVEGRPTWAPTGYGYGQTARGMTVPRQVCRWARSFPTSPSAA